MPDFDPISRFHKLIAALLSALFLLSTLALPAHAAGTGWYCVRAKNHAQPVADPPLREVEKYGGYYIDHTHTDPNASDKVVYLTFDAGYENGNVAKVLDALKAEGIHKGALVVFDRNEKGNAFWEKMGFTVREDLVYSNRALTELVRSAS